MIEINKRVTKRELYNFLLEDKTEPETNLSSIYYLIEYIEEGKVKEEPLYFTHFEDVFFESPCCLMGMKVVNDEELRNYVQSIYEESAQEDAYNYEKTMVRGNYLYEIDCPQCSPFLPNEVTIRGILQESECVDWLLNHKL